MTNNDNPTDQHRAEQVATDLERLAAFVRENPDLARKIGSQRFLHCLSWEKDPKAAMADIARRARRAGATMRKDVSEKFAAADLSFGDLTLHVYADRDQVCERIVVATREEVVEEPDPELLAKVPTVKRTVPVEEVRWECTPLLAPASDETTEVSA